MASSTPYTPYADAHKDIKGPGDSRPTALQVVKDCGALGKLKGKTVLITGCSTGLGVETARALYETGATVFMTARDMPKLEGIIEDIVKNAESNKDGPRPQGIKISLDSLESVREGAEDFKSKSGGKLNILIHNAGVMASPYTQTQDGFETQIGVNHFAHFLLFQLLKSCLINSAKESGSSSRVVNLTSAGHQFGALQFSNKTELDAWNSGSGYHKWLSYGQSKTSNIYMASSITRHYGNQNVVGLAVHPGGIMTDLARHLTEEDFASFGDWEEFEKTFKSVPQGAATTVWAAVSPHFEENVTGKTYLADVGETHPKKQAEGVDETGFAEWAYNPEKEELLWNISCDVVGIEDKK